MIRRETTDAFDLITQHDHALFSGFLARHLGSGAFGRAEPVEAVMLGVALHDSGWPLHDDLPTLNGAGFPLDVFETPPEIALAVWNASADRVAGKDAYAGLLVSLHVLSLSRLASEPGPMPGRVPPQQTPRQRFALNQFQHRQIELQETLRRRLGLANDIPLTFGLAEQSKDPRERQLARHFHLLQAMDQVSLAACCTKPPLAKTLAFAPAPGAAPVQLSLERQGDDLRIDPWPFDVPTLAARIPYRRLPKRIFEDDLDLRRAYAAAPVQSLHCTLRPG